MGKQPLSMEQIEKMAEKIAENNHFICPEAVLERFICNPPPVYAESIGDLPNDYLVYFLCSLMWKDVDFLSQYFDWKRFDSIQWGKLTARFGEVLFDKSDVKPYWGHEEWAYILSRIAPDVLAAACCDCDKWDEFTAKDWATVYGRSDEIDDKINAAVQKFSHQDWYDFLTGCDLRDDWIEKCPCLDDLVKEFSDFKHYM